MTETTLLPRQLGFMDEFDQDFLSISDHLAANVLALAELGNYFDILDAGCGYGRLAHSMRHATFS